MQKIYFSLLISFLAIAVLAQDGQKDYSEAFNLIEVWLEAQKDFEQLPGITAIIIEDQDVLWTGGFGMANPSTLFSICSISKLFTSVAIMKLYD